MKTQTDPLQETVPTELAGQRLDQILARLFPQYSRSRLQQWNQKGCVQVNDQQLPHRQRLKGGEAIALTPELTPAGTWQAQALNLDIVHEDEDLLIINKSAGMVVHPAAGNHQGTLVNALLHHDPELIHLPRAGLIHRLDKDTTGLLVVARNLQAHTVLTQALQARTIERHYLALARGNFTGGGSIDAPIGRHPRHRLRMAVIPKGKPARTHYRIVSSFKGYTLLKVMLETGRTHQIRVHMAHVHRPLVGDALYSGRPQPSAGLSTSLRQAITEFPRQVLHAHRLAFDHPSHGTPCHWEAPIPTDMQQLLALLQQEAHT